MQSELWENSEQFVSKVEQLADERLGETFVNEKYGNYRRNIEGLIEHGYYHLGQVRLMRKLLEG